MQAEYYALEGLSALTGVVDRIRVVLNPGLRIGGVLITMFDGRTKLAVEVLDEVNAHFPDRSSGRRFPRNVRLSEAPSYGKPAALFDVRSRGAQAYLALAREIGRRMSDRRAAWDAAWVRCSASRPRAAATGMVSEIADRPDPAEPAAAAQTPSRRSRWPSWSSRSANLACWSRSSSGRPATAKTARTN